MAMTNEETRKAIIRRKDLQAVPTAVGDVCMTKQQVLLFGGVT